MRKSLYEIFTGKVRNASVDKKFRQMENDTKDYPNITFFDKQWTYYGELRKAFLYEIKQVYKNIDKEARTITHDLDHVADEFLLNSNLIKVRKNLERKDVKIKSTEIFSREWGVAKAYAVDAKTGERISLTDDENNLQDVYFVAHVTDAGYSFREFIEDNNTLTNNSAIHFNTGRRTGKINLSDNGEVISVETKPGDKDRSLHRLRSFKRAKAFYENTLHNEIMQEEGKEL